jgi:hypothetical protein
MDNVEDVDPADDVLASFAVACATVFPPKKNGNKNYDLFCLLADKGMPMPQSHPSNLIQSHPC